MLDSRQLRYFIAVAEELHFGRAAERLHMAQPPLSQQIRRLEQRLGVTLLDRTTRRVELTPAGALLLERGRRLIAELDALAGDVTQTGKGVQGILRLGFTGTATYGLMPQVIREAVTALPGVSLTVSGELLTPQLEADLVEGRLDLAVLRPPVRNVGELAVRTLSREPVVVALPADSPLAAQPVLRLEHLRAARFVDYLEESTVARVTSLACREAGFTPSVVQRAKETSTLLSLVAAGAGVALVPAAAQGFVLNGAVFRPLAGGPTVELALAWRDADHSPLIARFVTFVADVVANTAPPRLGAVSA